MGPVSRFECASSGLSLGALLLRRRRVLWVALTVGAALHFGLAQITVIEAEQKAAKPLTTQFVKRAPRLTKPLELKKRPQPRRRQAERKMVAVKARMQGTERIAGFQPTQVLKGLARPGVDVGRVLAPQTAGLEPQAVAAAIEGSREVQQKIDMSLELLDVNTMDTGRYHAMVVQDPTDRRSVKGFCHLAIVYSRSLYYHAGDPGDSFENFFLPGFLRIPLAMNEYTDIKTDILGRLSLDDAEIFKAPWLCFYGMWRAFELTTAELENLGKYLLSGGFAFEDSQNHWDRDSERHPAYLSLKQATTGGLATQGVEATFEKLPNSHPIYHCYFDFDGPPIGGDAADNSIHPDMVHIIPYLEGLEAEGRLVALLSGKGYAGVGTFWGRAPGWTDWDPKRPFQFFVNTIVFALTQEGSITHRLMESVR